MDRLIVDVVWTSFFKGDVHEAAELLRAIADKLDAANETGDIKFPIREINAHGVPLAVARLSRDRR